MHAIAIGEWCKRAACRQPAKLGRILADHADGRGQLVGHLEVAEPDERRISTPSAGMMSIVTRAFDEKTAVGG